MPKKISIKFHPKFSITKAIGFWIAVISLCIYGAIVISKITPDLARWWISFTSVSIIFTIIYTLICTKYIKKKCETKAIVENGYISYNGKTINLANAKIEYEDYFFKNLFDVCDLKVKGRNGKTIKLKNISLKIKKYL